MFNAGRFFESHESFEDFYRRADDEHKPFLEGLVQLAAACRMFRDFAEVKGSVRMVRQALIRLENYQPGYLGIRVSDLIKALEEWAKRAEAEGEALKAEIPEIPLRRFFLF